MRLGLLLVCGVAACNWAFGIERTDLLPPDDAALGPDADPRIDLDRDGIKDLADPCIAPDTDSLVDTDGDGTINRDDACPLDARATADADGDGIGDLCDPTPGAPDLRRCVMAFTDPDLDVLMWFPREATESWTLYYPRMLFASMAGSIVAGWSFEAARGPTTYEIIGRLLPGAPSLSVLARAHRDPGSAQIDCTLLSTASGWQLQTTGAPAVSTGVAASTTESLKYSMQVTVAPDAADGFTLRCRASIGTAAPVSVETIAPLPLLGTFGFMGGRVTVFGISIYGRDDA